MTGQVAELQRSLSSLQEETDSTITKLRQELQDKANIVETLQQQIRMKMFMNLTTQVSDLQRSLTSLQEETDNTITKLRQELQDKANIVETLQQQIRMKMFMNLTTKNPMMAALADLQGKNPPSSQLLFCVQ